MKSSSSKGAFSSAMKDTLRNLLAERALRTGQKITLSTGRESDFYFNCKLVTLSSEGASLIADAFLEKLKLLPEAVTAVPGIGPGILGAIRDRITAGRDSSASAR